MSQNQLPEGEIQKLFTFVKSKNVPYKDVQFEIVDHLASAMEDLKDDNPEWSYSKCLDEIYNKFPITGFAILQLEKEEALKKYWCKKMLPFVKEYFKLPKILLTAALFIIFQHLISKIGLIDLSEFERVIFNTSQITNFLVILISTYRFKYLKNKPSLEEEYLFVKSFKQAKSLILLFLISIPFIIAYFHFAVNNCTLDLSGSISYLYAYLLTFTIISIHLSYKIFPTLLNDEADHRYGHMNIRLT